MAKRDIIGLDFREPKQTSSMVAALEALVDDSPAPPPVPPVAIPVETEPAAESFEIPIQNRTEEAERSGQGETPNWTDG
jgi:hypothetical protein